MFCHKWQVNVLVSVVLGEAMPQRDKAKLEHPGQRLVETSPVAILPVLSPGRATGGGGSDRRSVASKSDIEALMARMEMMESEHAKRIEAMEEAEAKRTAEIEALKRQNSEFRKKVQLHITIFYNKYKVKTDLQIPNRQTHHLAGSGVLWSSPLS